MPVNEEDIKRLSELARIKLDQEQKRLYAQELSPIVAMLDRLKEVDTTGVPAMTHVLELENILRKDKVDVQWTQEEAVKQAQASEDGFVEVPLRIK